MAQAEGFRSCILQSMSDSFLLCFAKCFGHRSKTLHRSVFFTAFESHYIAAQKNRHHLGVCFGAGRGIRTPVGLLPNGFQDRLVMTTSICLRIKFSFHISVPQRFSRLVPFRKHHSPRAFVIRTSLLVVFVKHSKKQYLIVFSSLTRYDHFDMPASIIFGVLFSQHPRIISYIFTFVNRY